jgi:hypothetical protein
MTTPRQYTIRPATADDTAALQRLAALDSAPHILGDVLLAELDDGIAAAISMRDGRAVADPFRPTVALVSALRTTRDNHLRRHARPGLRDRIFASLRPTGQQPRLAGAR